MLLLLRRRDEDVQDLVALAEQDQVGVPARELEEEGSPPRLGAELKEDQSVAADLLDTPQLCSSELGCDALIERTLWTRVPLEPVVLEVEPPGLRLAGEVEPEDRDVGAVWGRDEGEDDVSRGPRLHVAEGGPFEEGSKLLHKLADLSVVEVQLSSSWE